MAQIKNFKVKNDNLNNLLSLVKGILDIDNPDMTSTVKSIIVNVENGCNKWATQTITKKRSSKKHPNREIELTHYAYEKGFNEVIIFNTKVLQNEILKWVTGIRTDNYEQVKSMTTIVQNILKDLNIKIAYTLLSTNNSKIV